MNNKFWAVYLKQEWLKQNILLIMDKVSSTMQLLSFGKICIILLFIKYYHGLRYPFNKSVQLMLYSWLHPSNYNIFAMQARTAQFKIGVNTHFHLIQHMISLILPEHCKSETSKPWVHYTRGIILGLYLNILKYECVFSI